MDKLLPYFEQELGLLRDHLAELTQQHPRLGQQLGISGDQCGDPAVERLVQASAFLNGRLAYRLDSGNPRLTADLLERTAPHYLRPFPSCSIAQFEAGKSRTVATVERGTELKSTGESACRFRTAYDVVISPVAITSVAFARNVDMPPSLRLPAGTASALAVTIESTDPSLALAQAISGQLRLFVDTDPGISAAFFDALFMHSLGTCVEADGQWCLLAGVPFKPAGLTTDEALLPVSPGDGAGLRLLTEYFSFPSKFDFVDVDVIAVLKRCASGTRRIALHILLPDMRSTATPELLGRMPASALRLGCTPVVNLFGRPAERIRLTKETVSYPLRAEHNAEAEGFLYSVDAGRMIDRTSADLLPFGAAYGMQNGCYWRVVFGDAALGTEDKVSFVDWEQRPVGIEGGTASLQLTCTNGPLPSTLKIGHPSGDLTGDRVPGGSPIRLLRQPTVPVPAVDLPARELELLAALSPNCRDYAQTDSRALKALLALHAPAGNASAQCLLSAVLAIERHIVHEWIKPGRRAILATGLQLRLTVDEAAFTQRSLFVFALVLDALLGHFTAAHMFTQLVVLSPAGKKRLGCPLRLGSAGRR